LQRGFCEEEHSLIPIVLAAFLLGVAAGIRTFTAPAVLWIMKHGGIGAVVLAVLAVVEFAADLHPKQPARTSPPGLIPRIVSGGFVGWSLATTMGGPAIAGSIAGIAGALTGAFGGLAARRRAITAIGAVPAGLIEDAVGVALAIAAVAYA
jgi:uncharacterized membrane protein